MLQLLHHVLGQRFHLAAALRRQYHKEVGKAAQLTDIQQQDVRCLLLFRYLYYLVRYFQGFQALLLIWGKPNYRNRRTFRSILLVPIELR